MVDNTCDCQRAVGVKAEKSTKFSVRDKVPEAISPTPISGNTRPPHTNNIGQIDGSFCAENQLDPFSHFDRTPVCDRQTDRQTDTGLCNDECMYTGGNERVDSWTDERRANGVLHLYILQHTGTT